MSTASFSKARMASGYLDLELKIPKDNIQKYYAFGPIIYIWYVI